MKKSVLYSIHSVIVIYWIINLTYFPYTYSQQVKIPYTQAVVDFIFGQGLSIAIFYFAYLVFIPKYLVKKQPIKFALGALSLIIGSAVVFWMGGYLFMDILKISWIRINNDFSIVLFNTFMFALFGTFFRALIFFVKTNEEKSELEKQNFKSEVSLLKNQLNPHFLFNTLNNIDSLITENQVNASLALNKLSEIMRYMVYDSEKELVPLEDEINYIKNYISLQKLRIKNEEIIKFDIIGDTNGKSIAPIIFISFVENAFKHSSLKDREENKIEIRFALKDDLISFHCSNKIADIEKDKSSGVGLELVKKRLHLIYKNQHNLKIESSKGIFYVDLDIKLK